MLNVEAIILKILQHYNFFQFQVNNTNTNSKDSYIEFRWTFGSATALDQFHTPLLEEPNETIIL